MGKLVLVSGPNSSGKSRWAEGLLRDFDGEKFYIATMIPQTEDNRLRIEKHRRRRAGMCFQTLELPCDVGDAPVSRESAVLLEDVSNLLANTVFDRGGTAEEVFAALCLLRERCALLCAVTISGLAPEDYTDETADYIRALEHLNGLLLDAADAAVQMEEGIPRVIKGEV